jgi:hypothetical protein
LAPGSPSLKAEEKEFPLDAKSFWLDCTRLIPFRMDPVALRDNDLLKDLAVVGSDDVFDGINFWG